MTSDAEAQLESAVAAAEDVEAAAVAEAVVAAAVALDFAVAVDGFDFAGTFSNFIFSDSQSLEGFAKPHRQCRVTRARAPKHDQIQHKSYWDTRHRRNRAFHELCQATDSR